LIMLCNFSQPGGYEMISLCGFNLYFPDWHEIKQLFVFRAIYVFSSVKYPLNYFAAFS
jgi:hypothetical protein